MACLVEPFRRFFRFMTRTQKHHLPQRLGGDKVEMAGSIGMTYLSGNSETNMIGNMEEPAYSSSATTLCGSYHSVLEGGDTELDSCSVHSTASVIALFKMPI
jgi:hypothetical protein